MMPADSKDLVLSLAYGGRQGCARFTLGTSGEGGATLELHKTTAIMGGALHRIDLEGPGLGTLKTAEYHQLLRHCRHLLGPGGQLRVTVGKNEDQFPSAGLGDLAWRTGFAAWVDYVAGHAVLTKPVREVETTARVSIVMPVYKSEFFALALASAQAQTWPNCEIVVCDDSPDERIAEILAQSDGPHPVRYIRNPGNIGGRANYLQCYAVARGQYIKYLNDDDVLHPECVERMATVLDNHPAVTLVTSYRRLIDAAGNPMPDQVFNKPVAASDSLLDGRVLASHVLSRGINVIGEPTTAMFRKRDMADSQPHLMSYASESARRNGDMSIWISLLSRGDAVYLTTALSEFRQHGTQVQKDPDFQREAVKAWVELSLAARQTGLLDTAFQNATPATKLETGSDVAAGEKLYSDGQMEMAAEVFATLLNREPAEAQARGNLSCAHWELGDANRALVEGVLAHCSDPDNETIALNMQDMLAVSSN